MKKIPYEKAVKIKGEFLKARWGSIVRRGMHWAEQFIDAVLELRKDYPKVPRTDIIRDLRNIVGGMSIGTLEDYCDIIGFLRATHLEKVYRDPVLGISHVKVITSSGLPTETMISIILECDKHNRRKNVTPYTVHDVRTKVEIARGQTPTAKPKRVFRFNTGAAAAIALKRVLDAIAVSPKIVHGSKSTGFKAARKYQEQLMNEDEGPLFSS